MMIRIFKTMPTRNSFVAGLIIEIIIVTVIGWTVLEPVAVDSSVGSLPVGYDCDRMAMLTIREINSLSEDFDSTLNDVDHQITSQERLLRMIRERADVEKATFVTSQSPEQPSSAIQMIDVDSLYRNGDEENYLQIYLISYFPGTDFFNTFGIKDAEGKAFVEPAPTSENFYIVSQTVSKAKYPGVNAIGKDLYPKKEDDEDYSPNPILGVTEDISYHKEAGRIAACFYPVDKREYNSSINGIALRFADGANPRKSIDKIAAELDSYRSGNLYLTNPKLYTDMRNDRYAGKQRDLSRKWLIVVFFLVNVLLGVAGTFYVQCKTRIPDSGVMRAFGATRRQVEWYIVGDAWLTVLTGWLTGSVAYMLYLKSQGFPMEGDAGSVIQSIRPLWYDSILGRYSVIGGLLLVLLLAVSSIGAWLPARKVGRVSPVDALRDE